QNPLPKNLKNQRGDRCRRYRSGTPWEEAGGETPSIEKSSRPGLPPERWSWYKIGRSHVRLCYKKSVAKVPASNNHRRTIQKINDCLKKGMFPTRSVSRMR